MNILAIGDVYGKSGLDILSRRLRRLKEDYEADFVVVNGENAAGLGIMPHMADQLFDAGADVITLGNHAYNRREILDALDESPYILRPLNFASAAPGRGYGVYEIGRERVCVVNLIGRADMDYNADNPFEAVDRLLKSGELDGLPVIIDFHAEATSEKYAMAYHVDGRASVLFGTHTHVLTADSRVFPGGLGYLSDIGMTGPYDSVIGAKPDLALGRFLGLPLRLEAASGRPQLNGALFVLDGKTCIEVIPISIIE